MPFRLYYFLEYKFPYSWHRHFLLRIAYFINNYAFAKCVDKSLNVPSYPRIPEYTHISMIDGVISANSRKSSLSAAGIVSSHWSTKVALVCPVARFNINNDNCRSSFRSLCSRCSFRLQLSLLFLLLQALFLDQRELLSLGSGGHLRILRATGPLV